MHEEGFAAQQVSGFTDGSAANVIPSVDSLSFNLLRARAMLETAAMANVNFAPLDAAIVVGEEERSVRGVVVSALITRMPFMRTREQRVINAQHVEAFDEDRLRLKEKRLASWFAGLESDAERDSVIIEQTEYGEGYLSTLHLKTPMRSDGVVETFPLEHHFDFGEQSEVQQALPDSVKAKLEEHKSFWAGFNVSNGVELEKFIRLNFEKIVMPYKDLEEIPELQWMQAKDPDTYADLLAEKTESRRVHFWRLKKTPDSAIDDVLNLSKHTQHNYISTWLPAWMKHAHKPVILESDVQAIKDARDSADESLSSGKQSHLSEFMRQLIIGELDTQFASDLNLDGNLENMFRLRRLALGVVVEGPTTDKTRRVLDRANTLLDQELSGEKVTDRLMIDTALRTSEGIAQVLKAIIVLVPAAFGLENAPIPGIETFAPALGAGDDVVGAGGEAKETYEKGVSLKEVALRYSLVIPVAIGAIALGAHTQEIGNAVNENVAAATFALSTFMTSLATLGVTVRTYMSRFKRLAAENKLPDQPYIDETAKALIQDAASTAEKPATVTPIATETINLILDDLGSNLNISEQQLQRLRQRVIRAIAAGESENIPQHNPPSNRKAFKAAVTESFGNNPLRRGKLGAMPAMLGSAFVLGSKLLVSPVFYVPFGMAEAIVGTLWGKYASHREKAGWIKKVERHTAEANELRIRNNDIAAA